MSQRISLLEMITAKSTIKDPTLLYPFPNELSIKTDEESLSDSGGEEQMIQKKMGFDQKKL